MESWDDAIVDAVRVSADLYSIAPRMRVRAMHQGHQKVASERRPERLSAPVHSGTRMPWERPSLNCPSGEGVGK